MDFSWLVQNGFTSKSEAWSALSLKFWRGGCAKIPAELTPVAQLLASEGISYVFSTSL